MSLGAVRYVSSELQKQDEYGDMKCDAVFIFMHRFWRIKLLQRYQIR